MARLASRSNPAPLQPRQAQPANPVRQRTNAGALRPAYQHPVASQNNNPIQSRPAFNPGGIMTDPYGGGNSAPAGGGFDPAAMGTSAAPMSFAADTPVVTPPDPTTDPEYQAEHAALIKALADYQNEINVGNQQYDIGYNDNMRQLGWNADTKALDPTNMAGFYGQALDSNTNDFASRGMLTSGLYGKSAADIGTDYNNRVDQYGDARQGFLQGQGAQMASYKSQSDAADAALLRNVIARLSAQQQQAV